MEIFVLASGSKGNMTSVKNKTTRFFVDAGISFPKMKQKMDAYHENIAEVNILFLTHEHHDHIFGLKRLLQAGFIKEIYVTQGTLDALNGEIKPLLPQVNIIKPDEVFQLFDVEVTPILLSHDAREPVGFIFKEFGKKFVLVTDTGYVDQSYIEVLKDADCYLFEANHHPEKLLSSKRPYSLKQRILGIHGHLSNEDAARLMNQFIQNKKSTWIVAHISEDCNDIFDIEKAVVDFFEDPTKVKMMYASQASLPKVVL